MGLYSYMYKYRIEYSIQDSFLFMPMKLVFIGMLLMSHAHAEQLQGNQFSNNVAISYNGEELELSLTGLTIRKKFIFNVYSMAHYIEKTNNSSFNTSDKDIYSTVLQYDGAKQISMVFMRSLTAKQIKESLTSGIKQNSAESEYQQILASVEIFNDAITADVKENDEFTLRWFPDGTLVSLFQGQEISTIKDRQFAKALWSIWFSEKSVINRETLIEKLLTSS
jgi:chalcone isomerase-like protein